MTIHAALTTGKGTGAISTIEIYGDSVESALSEIFKPVGKRPATFQTGRILLGAVVGEAGVIDRVTVGCEGPDHFAVHCHGNPLIVEMIMELLRRHGATLVTVEELLAKTLAAQEPSNTIAIEARLAQMRARTIQGAKIIANQIAGGLAKTCQAWLDSMGQTSLNLIKAEAARILHNSQAARLIMYGCTVVLAGPPNSGKSTLLNYLAGRQKAIVTDIRGTTRDWVEAECRLGPLSTTLIDTAGLEPELSAPQPGIERAAREKTAELLEQADLVLLVLDGSGPADELDNELLERISDKRVITVLNKSDLPARFDAGLLPESLSRPARISAKEGTGVKALTDRILRESEAANFDLTQPVCFAHRQEERLRKLIHTESRQKATSIIIDLFKGRI